MGKPLLQAALPQTSFARASASLRRKCARLAGWIALSVIAAALLAPMAAQRPEGGDASIRSAGARSLIASDRADGEPPLPAPREEAPAKQPRVTALGVLLKRGKTYQAPHHHAAASSASAWRQPHARAIRIHAQAVAYLPDPAQHLHPGRAPPAA